MGLFGSLSEKLNHIFSKIKSRGKLSELEIKQAMREIRVALLEADVNFGVVKDFVARVSEKAVGEKILNSLTPGQQVVKIVNDELVELMGSTKVIATTAQTGQKTAFGGLRRLPSRGNKSAQSGGQKR